MESTTPKPQTQNITNYNIVENSQSVIDDFLTENDYLTSGKETMTLEELMIDEVPLDSFFTCNNMNDFLDYKAISKTACGKELNFCQVCPTRFNCEL